MKEAYPAQIQASNYDASDSKCECMCHVFDRDGLITVFNALSNKYLHVIVWDAQGNKAREYDNR